MAGVGTRVADRYRLTRALGAGGMGTVYEATDEKIGRRVALKLLEPKQTTTPAKQTSLAARMFREAKIIGRIDHPNVVRLFDVGGLASATASDTAARDEPATTPFLVMELLSGRDLGAVIESDGAQPIERAVEWVLGAAAGIAAAHACGVVHRDIKPSNLFLTDDTKRVVVLDFGASRAPEIDADTLTRTMGYVGTPLYASPEQLADARSADVRSDVWALGLVLYELLSGFRPFERPTLAAVGAAIVRDEVPALANVPPRLEAVVRRCLEKEAARRFASMDALARALAPWARESLLVDAVPAAASAGRTASAERTARGFLRAHDAWPWRG